MFDIVLGIFIFLSAIFFLPIQNGNINAMQFYQFGVIGNIGYNYTQLLFFGFGVITLFITSLFSEPQRKFKSDWAVILFSLFLVNLYLHPIGIKLFNNVFLAFLLYHLVAVYTKDYKKIFWFIFAVSLLNTVVALFQFPQIRPHGLMGISTHLGVYQAIALPICCAINPFLAIVPMVGIVLSKSVIAIFVMLCWMVIKSFTGIKTKRGIFKIKSFSVSLSFITIAIIFILLNRIFILQKLNIRYLVWFPTIKDILSHPFIGHGIRQFKFNSILGFFENPCSIYLQIIYYLGVLVLIPIFMMIKDLIKTKNSIAASLVVALLIGMEKSIFDFPRLAGVVIVLFGLLTITKGAQSENTV